MKHYSRDDQQAMAEWAADCAERVLPLFENAVPDDDRPRRAIGACRAWVSTGVFSMAGIREASLAAHAAAREVKENPAASFAARAAGQAVATAHVPQHAFGSAYYALKAVAASGPARAEEHVAREYAWQSGRLPEHLREVLFNTVLVQKHPGRMSIAIRKGRDF